MRIYTTVVTDIETGLVLDADSFEYQGPVALCGDAGLGGGLAGGDVGGGGDVAVDEPSGDTMVPGGDVEAPSGGIPESDISGETISELEPSQETPPAEEAPGKPILPRELTKAIREMKEAHPEHSQALSELQRNYFARQEFGKVFQNPEEALDAKATIEMLGGKEGIARMRSYESVIRDIDDKVERGEPEVIEDMARSSPDGFKKLVPHALEVLSQVDRLAYAETVRPLVLQDLKGSGFADYLRGAVDELAGGDTERANRYLKAMQQWIADAEKQEETKRNRYQDPRVQELERREREATQRERGQLSRTVEYDLGNYLRESVGRSMSNLVRQQKLTTDGRDHVIRAVGSEINQMLMGRDSAGGESFYSQSMRSLLREGNREKVMNYARAQIDQVRQKAINKVWARLYPSSQRSAPRTEENPQWPGMPLRENGTRTASPAPAAPQPRLVTQRPSWQDVDMKKTSQDDYLAGRAWLKSGKLVSWKRV